MLETDDKGTLYPQQLKIQNSFHTTSFCGSAAITCDMYVSHGSTLGESDLFDLIVCRISALLPSSFQHQPIIVNQLSNPLPSASTDFPVVKLGRGSLGTPFFQ